MFLVKLPVHNSLLKDLSLSHAPFLLFRPV